MIQRFWKNIAPPVRWICLVSLLITLALLLNVWEGLRGGYGWRWGYDVPERMTQWLPTVLTVLIYTCVGWWLLRRKTTYQLITWSLLGCALMPFIFLLRWGDPLYIQFTRVVSGGTSGPHLIAANYNPDTIDEKLKHWTDEQSYFASEGVSMHAALAPPGMPLLYYGANHAFAQIPPLADAVAYPLRPMQCDNLDFVEESSPEIASASLGMLSPLWAALAILPLFWLARRVSDEPSARRAALLWGLVPGLAMFTPVPNTVFPALAIFCVALLWRALEDRAYGYAFAAGVVASVMTFLNFSVIPLLLFCGLLALGYHLLVAKDSPRWWSVAMGCAFGAGLVTVWAGWMIYGGEPPWEMLNTAMAQHLEAENPYLPWVVLHLWDYTLFLGLPVLLLALWVIWQGIHAYRREKRISRVQLFALVLGLSILIMDISGTARRETGRVWQFFFPVTVLVAAASARELSEDNERVLLAAQGTYAVVLLLFVPVIATGLPEPPQEPPAVNNPMITGETSALFWDSFYLTGFGGTLDSDNNLVVDLRWKAEKWSEQPYYIAIIPVAPDGEPYREGFVYQPFDGAYPTTCWQPGQTIVERVSIQLEGQPPAGEWWLSITVYDYHNFTPLPVTFPDGSTDFQAGVGAIVVE